MDASLDGRFDGFRGNRAYGWVWLRGRPDQRLRVKLVINDEIVEERTADIVRGDLRNAGIGDGGHGFEFILPERLLDKKTHVISIVCTHTGEQLPYSNRTFSNALMISDAELKANAPWPDQPDADDLLFDKIRSGEIDLEDYRNLLAWRQDGFLLLRNAIDPALIDTCNMHVDRMLAEKLPVTFVSNAVRPTPWNKVEHVGSFASTRFLEFHCLSEAARDLSMHPRVMRFLRLIFNDTPVCMQSLLFIAGTQQRAHLDFPYVHTPKPAYLAASWIALEDVRPEAGPLFYYPKSHRLIRNFDFGFGNTIAFSDGPHIRDFEEYLQRQCDGIGLERRQLMLRKGDFLIWHYALVHGGSPVADKTSTRRSLVTHFSSRQVYNRDRRYPTEEPIARNVNGGVYYDYKDKDRPMPIMCIHPGDSNGSKSAGTNPNLAA